MSRAHAVELTIAKNLPRDVDAVGIPVAASGPVPRAVGVSRSVLAANGFSGKLGDVLAMPQASGPTVVVVGVGERPLNAADLRTAAAKFSRATSRHARLATSLTTLDGVSPVEAVEVVTEAILLARYHYAGFRSEEQDQKALQSLTLASGADAGGATKAAERGRVLAGAAELARDLANTPPAALTARLLAERALEIGAADPQLDVEVFELEDLARLGCGGIIGVNQASAEPPRMVKLTYRPARARQHVALVGKGVTYDSGGISLKPSDEMHAMMKLDMSGAAAVLATMSALAPLGSRSAVTGFLMCTDNMPSGSALKLGDVLTIRNGKTVEVHNTDAEGRLILADGLSLAAEEAPDAIIDIATLTGACMVALGAKMAGLFGNDEALMGRIRSAGDNVSEPVWPMPLARDHYRKLLDSNVADMKNIGNRYGGAIQAAIFLSEFVGDVPWAHLDIAGPMMSGEDDGIWSKGGTAFGTRLLIDLLAS
ncbi:MAG: leucyl aminopeptidase [Actinomycetota bacterium]|nr:leucyl aminopeptidase [Actinomycetota bacterium]